MTYNLKLQIKEISVSGDNAQMAVCPILNIGQTASDLLGYRLCNNTENHKYFLWFKDTYNQCETVIIARVTSMYETWFIVNLRAPNPIEEFDFKYHRELLELLEDSSIGLLFELGNKSNE